MLCFTLSCFTGKVKNKGARGDLNRSFSGSIFGFALLALGLSFRVALCVWRTNYEPFGSASYALNGCVFHHICRSHRTVSLSSAEAEWYAAISAACEGIFLRAIFVFMAAAAECSLDLKIDNSAARQLALRQGVGNKTRHVAGRLLWLQQSVREKVLDVGAIASAYNLGDLSTKMHSANRLRALLFLHGFVDALTGAAVGEDGFARMALLEQAKLQVKRVLVEYARQHGVTGSLKGEAGKLTKQVALLILLCLPTTSEAAEAANPYQSYGMSNMTWATVLLCCCLCIYRALSWAGIYMAST